MTAPKHTPGPWLVLYEDAEAKVVPSQADADRAVAEADEKSCGSLCVRIMPLSQVIAVPDMKEALIAVRRSRALAGTPLQARVEAAIAKAEGGAS